MSFSFRSIKDKTFELFKWNDEDKEFIMRNFLEAAYQEAYHGWLKIPQMKQER